MKENKIAELALERGIRHSHIAKMVGVSSQTFSRWVNNHSQPDLFQAYIIAKTLNVSMETLIKKAPLQ